MDSTNQTAAFLCGGALQKLFPQSPYLGSEANENGFSCTILHEGFDDSLLPLIEAKMRELASEEISFMEMVASNAIELFNHLGLKSLGNPSLRGVVEVARMGEFADYFEGEWAPSVHFALLQFREKKGRVRIEGIAFPSRDELKNFLKLWRQYPKLCHTALAKKLDLYEEGSVHPRGVAFKRAWKEFWQKQAMARGFEEVEIEPGKEAEYVERTGRSKICYWDGERDFFYIEGQQEKIPLQFMEEIARIFDLKFSWERKKHQQVLLLEDGLGRRWAGPTLVREKRGIKFSLFGSLSTWIALFLEQKRGEILFALAPEQAVLIPLDGVDPTPVCMCLDRAMARYRIDRDPKPLREKIHRALQLNVPYVMIYGKTEEKEKRVTIRAKSSKRDDRWTYEKLEKSFHERQWKFENQSTNPSP